jgi:hypothetical protein
VTEEKFPPTPVRPWSGFWESATQQAHVEAVVRQNPIEHDERSLSYIHRIAVAAGLMDADTKPAPKRMPEDLRLPYASEED